jgi:hypothetical protein
MHERYCRNALGSIPFLCKEGDTAVLASEPEKTATMVLNMRLHLMLSLRFYEKLWCLSLPEVLSDKKLVR